MAGESVPGPDPLNFTDTLVGMAYLALNYDRRSNNSKRRWSWTRTPARPSIPSAAYDRGDARRTIVILKPPLAEGNGNLHFNAGLVQSMGLGRKAERE